MAFRHGVYVKEQESELKGLLLARNPVVVVGTAPINMGDMNCVNKPVLINNVTDATKYFGGVNDIEGFTITEALFVAFQVFGVYPIICINVLDPATHKATKTYENLAVVNGRATISETGIIPSSVIVKKSGETAAITEFNISFDTTGKATIILEDKTITKIEGTYDHLDPSKVLETDIIGSIDPTTLEKKGLECLNDIFPKYSMIPSYVIAPSYNSNTLRAILDTKASLISSKYTAMTIFDIPETTKYGEVIEFKKENNWIDEEQILTYGKIKFGGKYYNQSVFLAMLSANTDADNDGVPYESPSNLNIKAEGIAIKGEEGYTDLILGEEEANILNENGIVTVIQRPNGTVAWGNRTSCYQPGGNTDPKDAIIPAKRMFKWLANNLILNCATDVDRPMTFSKASNIQMKVNTFLNSLTAREKLLGGRVEFKKGENPAVNLIDGKFTWHIYIGIVGPGEDLEFILEHDADYVNGYFA